VSLEVVAAEILIHRAILEHAWESTTFTATFDILHGVSFSNTCSGFIGGSQIGYNRQVSPYSRSAYVRGGRHQFERRYGSRRWRCPLSELKSQLDPNARSALRLGGKLLAILWQFRLPWLKIGPREAWRKFAQP
jgi:hypothetical protein